MSRAKTKILLVEDNPGDARLIREMLAETEASNLEIDWVPHLSAGLEKLRRSEIDLVLLDLGLPDSRGLDTFIKAYAHAPEIPFVVLTGLDDETLALTAVREGAQDYLVKGQTDGEMLMRAIRYATERKKIEEDLRQANEALLREMAERQAAEIALKTERQRLFAMLDGLPALVHLKDQNFAIRFANRVFRETFGDWESKHCFEVIMGCSGVCQQCSTAQVFETGLATAKEWTDPVHGLTYQMYNYPFVDEDGSNLVLSMGFDITRRKRAEDEIKEHEEELFTLYENAPLIMVLLDEERRILKANKFAEIFAGAPAAELLGRRGGEALRCLHSLEDSRGCGFGPNCQHCRVRAAVVNTFKTGRSHHQLEACLPFPLNGETREVTFLLSTAPLTVRGQNQVLLTIQDISERKQAEVALRESEARLAKAQNLAHLGHWEWDLSSDRAVCSEEIYRIFGVAPEEVVPTFETMMSYVHPDDQERVRHNLAEALAAAKPYNLVGRIVRPDGAVRYVHSQAEVVFDEQGKPRRMLGTAQDITERRLAEMRLRDSEARFRAIFEGAAMGIGLTDMRGRFLTVNKTLQKMLGYAEEEIWGRTCLGFTHPEDVEMSREFFAKLHSGQVDRLQIIKRFQRQDGRYFWGRTSVSLVRDGDGQPLYTIGMVEDITQAKQAEERLHESETRLRYLASRLMSAQEDERRRIARELHDELGQSLLVLKLQARSIERALHLEQRPIRAECRELLTNLDQLVNNVRRLSRDLSPTVIEDLGLSTALQRLLQEFSKHYQIEFSTAEIEGIHDLLSPEAQITVYRIFQESLTNIGKHSQATQLMVSITRADDLISFLIQDNGKGFDLAQCQRQAPGMGLAAMEERARMVGGVLSIWSQEGAGTKISLFIPYSARTT